MSQTDLIIIGSGPGGYVAAIRAAQLGLKVMLIEREQLGGICLNWGCIPTKALLRSSEILNLIKHADVFGITVKDFSFDLKKIVERSRKVSMQLSGGVKHLMKKNKVEVVEGRAVLLGKGKVEVTAADGKTSQLEGKNIILATGARARVFPGLEPDGKLIWTYKEALQPDVMPQSLLVVGSGAIGIEFASFFRTLGAEVTVVEVMDRILPVEDEEVSAFARKSFEKQGMKIMTGATVKKLTKGANNVTAMIEQGGNVTTLTVDRVIMAVGITGNVENIGLENTKAKIDRGHVVINQWSETGEPGLYAIGDVAGPPWLAHKASHEGVIAVEKIAGVKGVHPLNTANIPGCTY
ncbi:MAG: dihydrolipoyl dehydrogenase, partial [Alphaproteobacteria bacterium]